MEISKSIIRMEKIVKWYRGTVANDNVDFTANAGEVHTIVGENGAGKSTLVKILSGVVVPESGAIYIQDKYIENYSPQVSYRLGIGMVYQNFMLVETMTVIENVMLGFEPVSGLCLDFAGARQRIRGIMDHYNIHIPVDKFVSELTVGQKQKLEIIKLIFRDTEIFIFDEPTSVLVPDEVDGLFRIFTNLKSRAKTIIFITHKIDEVFRISDRISIMRQGRLVKAGPIEDFSKNDVIYHMIGKNEISSEFEKKEFVKEEGSEILEIENLCLKSGGKEVLKGINLRLFPGEILGIAGVEGNGQRELVNAILGLTEIHAESGRIFLKTKGVRGENKKFSFIPEDTVSMGIIPDFNIMENFILGMDREGKFRKLFFFRREPIKNFTKDSIDKYGIKVGDINDRIDSLSGGNIQKVVLARELSRDSSLIIGNHPTRGLDIVACEFIHKVLIEKRNEGRGILLISADLNELIKLSDCIQVIFNGRLCPRLERHRMDKYEIGKLMTGKEEII